MLFAGLPFAELAAIFGVAGAAVVALYILRLRRRTVAIPFSPLWERVLRDKEATSLFSKLKRLLSLLLQLVLLALLCFALGDPRAKAAFVKGRNVVVLLDASASMQATDVSPTRLSAAKDEVKAMIRGLSGADRMLLAQMDAVVTPLGPMSGDTSELERDLSLVKPTEARADFARALRFATDALRGLPEAEIIVVSDGHLGEAADSFGPVHTGDVKVSYVKIGSGKDNVAITQFSVRRYPLDKSRYEVMLEVTNTGESDAVVELTLTGDGQPVDVTTLRLHAGERLPRFYPNLSGASRTLEAKISLGSGERDLLPADDHAYALLPERHRAKVLVVSPGNMYLDAALLLDEYLDVTNVTPQGYASTYPAGAPAFDAVIFDGVTPASPPRANAVYLDPRGPGSPVKVDKELKQPGFDKVDRKHPVARFIALDDVNIARGHKLLPLQGDKVVGASDEGALLVAGTREGRKFVALGFDVRDSDLALRVAWPVFLLNAINWFSDDDASYLSSFRTGDVWHIALAAGAPADSAVASLKLPDGTHTSVPVHDGRAVYLGQHSGFYEVSQGARLGDDHDESGGPTSAFAANLLDVDESTIAPRDKLVVDGKEAGPAVGFHVGVRRELWIYLLLAAALLTALEWATYHRRLTV
jgi:von Willebrand factor type A domain/Aerotolerance regulator N-terminal